MNQKTKRIIGAVIVLIAIVGGIFAYRNWNLDKGSKEITMSIKVEGKTVFDDKVKTDAPTLADLLKEMKEDKDIQLEYQSGTYGMYITAMGTEDAVYKEDKAKGMYWMYNSKNNEQCKKAGYCDAADSLKIADKDAFEFTLEPFKN